MSALFWGKFLQVGVETLRRDGEAQEFFSFTPTSKCFRLRALITVKARNLQIILQLPAAQIFLHNIYGSPSPIVSFALLTNTSIYFFNIYNSENMLHTDQDFNNLMFMTCKK